MRIPEWTLCQHTDSLLTLLPIVDFISIHHPQVISQQTSTQFVTKISTRRGFLWEAIQRLFHPVSHQHFNVSFLWQEWFSHQCMWFIIQFILYSVIKWMDVIPYSTTHFTYYSFFHVWLIKHDGMEWTTHSYFTEHSESEWRSTTHVFYLNSSIPLYRDEIHSPFLKTHSHKPIPFITTPFHYTFLSYSIHHPINKNRIPYNETLTFFLPILHNKLVWRDHRRRRTIWWTNG